MKYGFYGENFIDEASAAASVSATRGVKVGGTVGNLYAKCIAGAGGFSIASGKTVTLTASESDTLSGTYNASGVATTRTFSAATVIPEGEVICELGFPSYVKDFAKIAFTCNDSNVSGKIKVIPYARG
ncbi:MAG: hypothetical protein IJ545_04715 [Alphaproteobacteria bacterium]|nr:hypothetical protein [Alphaproteobacteria bacterium]